MPHDITLAAEPTRAPAEPVVFGFSFATETHDAMLDALTCGPQEIVGTKLLVTANLDHIVTLRGNAPFRDAYSTAWRITADGMPVYLYARLRGANVPERVTGSDLFADLCEKVRPGNHRLFLLASNAVTGEKIRQHFLARGFAHDAVTIEVPPFGFENDDSYSRALTERIRKAQPTHLVMGVGAPKSEIWANRNRDSLGNMFVLCVGASLEFFTGEKSRAPEWVGRMGLEWLHRFLSEPRRLFHRYFVRSWSFLGAVAHDIRG